MPSGCIGLGVGEHWLLDFSVDDDVHDGVEDDDDVQDGIEDDGDPGT